MTTREKWLNDAVEIMNGWLQEHGEQMPDAWRVSCGWPSRGATARRNRTIGQCFPPECADDACTHIFISPVLDDPTRVLDVLLHEMVHAAVGCEHGHKGPFRRLAVAVGLEGKMTATHAGEDLQARLDILASSLGPYPHAKLDTQQAIKKQGTRMIKVECPECGYVARITRKWLDEVGAPHCPLHGPMEEDI